MFCCRTIRVLSSGDFAWFPRVLEGLVRSGDLVAFMSAYPGTSPPLMGPFVGIDEVNDDNFLSLSDLGC